jgi:hypothetical protein
MFGKVILTGPPRTSVGPGTSASLFFEKYEISPARHRWLERTPKVFRQPGTANAGERSTTIVRQCRIVTITNSGNQSPRYFLCGGKCQENAAAVANFRHIATAKRGAST